MSLSVSSFTIPNTNKPMTLIYFNDTCVPRGVKAFFRLDYQILNRAKIRVNDKGRILRGDQLAFIRGEMHKIAMKYNYNWQELLEAAKGRQY